MTPVRHADERAERAALGCAILDRECAIELCALVDASDYFDDRNALLHAAVAEQLATDGATDWIGVRGRLETTGTLARVGGDEYLMRVTDVIPNLADVERYGKRVRELAAVRAAVEAARRVLGEAQEGIEDPADFLSRSENAIGKAIEDRALVQEPVTLSAALDHTFDRLENHAGKGVGHATGYTLLDRYLGGLAPELIILAGRPGMAKTALACNLALGVEESTGLPVHFQSIEMPTDQITQRLICIEAGVDGRRLREGKLSSQEMQDARDARARLAKRKIWIDDTPRISLNDFARLLRKRKRRDGLALGIVDYLQLMRPSHRMESREREVAEISAGLKSLSKELRIPILALASLNRGSEKRNSKDKRPDVADLRESGSIESDADTVLLMYRDEVYNADTDDKNIAEVIIGKQRSGPTGTVRLRFDRECMRFSNLEYARPEPEQGNMW